MTAAPPGVGAVRGIRVPLAALLALAALALPVREALLRADATAVAPDAAWISRAEGTRGAVEGVLEIPFDPVSVELRVAMHPAGAAFLNGRPMARLGYADVWRHVLVMDATAWAARGRNVVALDLPPGDAGALVWMEARAGDGRRVRLASGASFTAGGRPAAVRLTRHGRPWRWSRGPMAATPLAAMRLGPERAARDLGSGLFDLGREEVGYLVLRGAAHGSRALMGERREEASSPRAMQREAADLRDGAGVGFRRHAFRYVRLEPPQPGAEVGVVPVGAREEPTGAFACGDADLQHAYDVSRETLRLSMQDVLEDGPKRDRKAWAVDLLVAAPAAALAYGRSPTVARSFRRLASQRTPSGAIAPSWPAHEPWLLADAVSGWLAALDAYVRLSGDDALARELLPEATAQAAWLGRIARRGPFSLAPSGPITDWMSHARRGGRVTYQQGMAVLGLRAASRLTGDVHAAAAAERLRRSLAALAPGASGLLADRIDGPPSPAPHDASVLVLLAGASGGREREILDAVRRRLWTPAGPRAYESPWALTGAPAGGRLVAPFMAGLEALARFQHDDVEGALELLRRTWRPMTASGAAYELMDLEGGLPELPDRAPFAVSACHSWSTAPAWLLPAYVLGVRPDPDRAGAYLVAPRGLPAASGAVPTPAGILRVSFAVSGAGGFIDVDAPRGLEARLDPSGLLPGASVSIDGELAPAGIDIPAGRTRFALAPGGTSPGAPTPAGRER